MGGGWAEERMGCGTKFWICPDRCFPFAREYNLALHSRRGRTVAAAVFAVAAAEAADIPGSLWLCSVSALGALDP